MSTWKTSEPVGVTAHEIRNKSISPPASGARKVLGTKLRFEIFKRDGFRCVYCGNRPPDFPLHVDHKIPLAEGGTNQPDNLVTSCQPCNIGKRDVLLEEIPKFERPLPDLPAAARTKYAFDTFKMYGRKYRIYKRTKAKTGSWYFLLERGGKRYATSLKTDCCATATERAKLLVEAAEKEKFHEMRAIVKGGKAGYTREFCTIDKYLAAYENTGTGGAVEKTRHQFVGCFKRLLAKCAKPPERMDQLGPFFKDARAQANKAIEFAPDNAAKMRIQRSFNSEIGNAASVFSQKAVYFLKDHLELPDFTSLRLDIKFLKFPDAKKTTEQYQPPSADVRDETLKTWLTLPRNEFLAVGLALACGMRKGEMKGKRAFVDGDYVWQGAADWSWFEWHEGNLWVNGKGSFKDKTDTLRAQVLNPFWDLIVARCEKEGWEMKGQVLTGNRSDFDKVVSAWLKGLGWETRLHLHALRAWAGSLVFMKYGIAAACSFCRHSDESTTRENYGWMRNDWHTADTEVTVAGKPVEWARVPNS